MPEANEDLPRPLRGRIPLIPAVIAAVLVLGAAIFAWSHLAAKGPAPQADATPQQVATGQTEPTRSPYSTSDFTEPDKK